jgi:hypothetical protein
MLLFLKLSGKFVVGRMNLLLNLLGKPPPQPFRLVMYVFNPVQTLLRSARSSRCASSVHLEGHTGGGAIPLDKADLLVPPVSENAR